MHRRPGRIDALWRGKSRLSLQRRACRSHFWKTISCGALIFCVMHTGYGYFAVFSALIMLLMSLIKPKFSFSALRKTDLVFLMVIILIMIVYYIVHLNQILLK